VCVCVCVRACVCVCVCEDLTEGLAQVLGVRYLVGVHVQRQKVTSLTVNLVSQTVAFSFFSYFRQRNNKRQS
jgi:hypothetical protein